MKTSKILVTNKTKATTIALILTLTIAATLVALPTANAELPVVNLPSWIFVSASPDSVGVGQTVYLIYWTSLMPIPTEEDPARGTPGGRECWTGITLTITDPEGTTQTVDMPPSDSVGGGYYTLTPDKVGTWSVQAHFPAQWRNVTTWPPWGGTQGLSSGTAYYLTADDSEPSTFVVQEEPIEPLPEAALPTEYWTRPIDAYNRAWYTIAGNWITGLRDLQYITAPDTAHIVWTEPYFFGGVAGGAYEWLSYHMGGAYQSKFASPVIMQGILFYKLNLGSSADSRYSKVVARDLRTGELLWEKNNTAIINSWIYDFESPNQHGVHPYLTVTGNIVLDPFSGTELFRYTNVPAGAPFGSGVTAIGPHGEWLIYVPGGSVGNQWLALWNATAAPGLLAGTTSSRAWQWRPGGKVIDGNDAYSWNVTLPPGLPGRIKAVLDDRIIGGDTGPWRSGMPSENFTLWAVSLEEGQQGQLLWKITEEMPVTNTMLEFRSASLEAGVFFLRVKETRQMVGYDINTGEQLWITEPQPQFDMYDLKEAFAYGKLYIAGWSGKIHAYDYKTGELLWTTSTDSGGLDGPYPYWPIHGAMYVIDGKIYAIVDEHSPTQPLYKGWKLYCFDAETGDRLWAITGFYSYGYMAVSDGYLVGHDCMANQITAFGKGPSATAVSIQNDVITHGNSVLVKGMVTDVSAGTKSDRIAPRFPNGVPAIADENMTAWMEYVYKQMPKPTDATGVEVVITTLDPNGNTYELGRTTTDIDGTFGCVVDPPVPGKYKIMATFEGSDSYYGSSAVTYLWVEEAPSPAQTIEPESTGPEPTEPTEPEPTEPTEPEPTEPTEPAPTEPEPTEPEPTEPAEAPFITTEIAIIAAVIVAVIIGIAAYWQLRKRK